nr:hypothetical protein [Limosilactobacillus reuteri]
MVNRKIRRSQSEYYDAFIEQLKFLNYAAKLYDNGERSAIKMATPQLRTLFYQQSYGDILINLIPEVNKNKFLSTCQFGEKPVLYGEVLLMHLLLANMFIFHHATKRI